jgi:hypothetical protein
MWDEFSRNWRMAALGLAGTLLFALGLGLIWHWSPERVVKREFSALLHNLEKRNWKKVSQQLSEKYRDAWHEDRSSAVAQLNEIFRQFFWVELTPSDSKWQRTAPDEFLLTTRLNIAGEGTPLAQLIKQEANRWSGQLELRYVKQSGRPGDWKLQEAQPNPPPTW